MSEPQLDQLAKQVIDACAVRGLYLALAESLTGGLAASTLVSVPGASKVLLASVVAYADSAKHQILGVPSVTLATFGAVSEQTALAMAAGAAKLITNVPGLDPDHIIGASTTGVAGPDLQEGKPVGQVQLGFYQAGSPTASSLRLFGSRDEIRVQTVAALFAGLLEQIKG